MKKFVLRLLALVLVLCMVVPCMPIGALATELIRPENISDEEWEVLRQKLLAELAANQESVTETTLPQTDSLSKGETGNLVVTDKAEDKTPADVTVPEAAEEQTVSVELPAKADTIKEETGPDGKDVITNEYKTTIAEGTTEEKKVAVEESYDLKAEITAVETEGTGDENVTDITYEISLDASVSAVEANPESGTDPTTVVKSDVVENVDIVANQAVKEENKDPKTDIPQPQYKVDMTANGMNADEITRVEHRYKTSDAEGATEEVEYYYNAKNGTEDTTKKYFTVTVVEKVKEVKETVVSLWTGFLGIFHITTDAFEDVKTKDTYASLEEAQKFDIDSGSTQTRSVEMLRDYKTDSTADLNNSGTKLNVDLKDHTYTNISEDTAIQVGGNGNEITIQNGDIISNGDGIQVSDSTNSNKLSLKNILLRSNANNNGKGNEAAVKVGGSKNTVNIEGRSWIDGIRSTYGVYSKSSGTDENTVNISKSKVEGKTGVSLTNSSALLSDSILRGTSGAALAVDGNTKANDVVITGGRFESGKDVANIYAKDKDDIASITVKGGRYTNPAGLYSYIPYGYALISHNDGSYFRYEVVSTDYTPTRDGYSFQGYTDANGNPISLKEAFHKGIIAYAQWKEIPETTTKPVALITVKTDEKGCTTKVIYKGDTAFVTVKDAKGEFAPISEVVIPSIKRLQNKKIDTVEIQVDEDVSLVLDIEKAKENGFTDIVEVMLEKDMLLITSGQDTCIELNIAELKEADKPVTIQLVEGELTIMLGKNSSMTVDLTKALKTKERIVVKLENGVLKLYDKYHKPLKD